MRNKENCDYPATRIEEDPPDLIPMVNANPNFDCCKKCVLNLTKRCWSAKLRDVRCLSSERPNREIIYFVHKEQKKGKDKNDHA